MKLIIGLGNPGPDYAHTRHNIGWDAVSVAARKFGNGMFRIKKEWKAEVAEASVDGKKVLFVHPLTFMNLSGDAVLAIKQFYKSADEDVLVVQDEMDYLPGKFAFVKKAGPAGHNGIVSIQERLATDKIARFRIGIGRPVEQIAKEDYVLQKFTIEEAKIMEPLLITSAEAIRDWVLGGIDTAMNSWNVVKR